MGNYYRFSGNFNQSFRALFYCKNCNSYSLFNVRFKEYFDHIDIKTKKTKVAEEEKNAEKKDLYSPL